MSRQGEGGGLDPPASGGLLSHQRDLGGMPLDGQVYPDGLLGGPQVGHGMPLADGQMGDDVAELALERREGGEGPVDSLGQGTEGARITRAEPQHLVAEPVRVIQPEAESADRREQMRKLKVILKSAVTFKPLDKFSLLSE